ncbi:MAG: alkaline shock response membrane anchor protein AmaP [Anaerolineae bacterium]|nr:alkaline shock response membrane anchor protein AmaP [Anaerolineae bacterium]
MNVFNRIIVVLLLLVIIVLAAVYVIAPGESLRVVAVTADWLQRGTVNYVESDRLLFAGARVIIGGALIILCLLILWLELRRPRRKSIRAQKLEGGEARITIESVEQRLEYNIDQLPDVIKVSPQVTGRTRGVDVDLLLETSPEVDIPMKTEEVLQVTREVIVERMGLKLGKVQVKIKHAPYPKE